MVRSLDGSHLGFFLGYMLRNQGTDKIVSQKVQLINNRHTHILLFAPSGARFCGA